MFKCAITGKFSAHTVKPIRLIVERRARDYVETYFDEDDNIKRDRVVGHGWEIVKEIDVTLEGLGVWCSQHPDDFNAAVLFEKMKKHEALQQAARLRAPSKEAA